MKGALLNVAIDTAEGVGISLLALVIFAVIAMLWFSTSRALRTQNSDIHKAWLYPFPKSIFRFRNVRVDLTLYIFRYLFWQPLLSFLTALMAGVTLNGLLVEIYGRRPNVLPSGWSALALQFAISLLAYEFSFYVWHRWSHTNRFLWSTHRVHHSIETLTFLARNHPLEDVMILLFGLVIAGPINALFLYFTGTEVQPGLPTVLLVYGIWSSLEDKFNHSHVPFSFGPFNRIFMSGHMHQIHHSAELRHRDKNFGASMSIYDWIFGTIYLPKPGEIPRLGLSEEQLGDRNPHKTVFQCLCEPFSYLKKQFSR